MAYKIYLHMVSLNYNFIVTCVSTCGATRNLQYIPVICLHGLRFLMVWNIHVSCNLLCATCGIVRHRVAMHVTAMQETCIGKYLIMPLLQECNEIRSFIPIHRKKKPIF